jgi:uracil-DNA glycosylase family 4
LDDAFALLRLQVEWGADEAIDADPSDRLRSVETAPSVPQRVAPAARPVAGPAAGPGPEQRRGTPAEQAQAVAGQAATLDALRAALAAFDGCALRDTASNLVFAEGNEANRTLIIGEPPGREEDRSGHPFAGAEGALLDQMLASIRLSRTELLLAPLLPWRPPGGRPPSPAEIAVCLPFLHRLIGLLKPDRIVLFGATAARVMLGQPVNRRRGPLVWVSSNIPGMSSALPALALPGLAEMLKNPLLRRDAWVGLRLLRRTIDQAPT